MRRFCPGRRALLRAAAAASVAPLIPRIARTDEAPKPGDQLAMATVTALGRLLRTRVLSVRKLVQDHLDRIARYDGPRGLNAFLTVDYDGALRQAARLDELLGAGRDLGPLHGIPVAVADDLETRGLRTTGGTKILANWIPREDAWAVMRLRAAGAVILGKTSIDELEVGTTGNNPHFGTTRNPFDRARVAGGASAGAAAAVAGGLAVAAVGLDSRGSLRIPAALCGVVGLRPTCARVSRQGALGLSFSRDVVGTVARSVEDAALVLAAVAGSDARDASTRPVPDYAAGLVRGLHGIKVGIPRRYFWEANDAAVARVVAGALTALQGIGATLVDVDVPGVERAREIGDAIVLPEAAHLLPRHLSRGAPAATLEKLEPELGPAVREMLRVERAARGDRAIAATAYLDALRTESVRLEEAFAHALAGIDALVTPTTPVAAPRIADMVIEGAASTSLALARDCDPVSTTCLPAVSVPAGWVTPGLPVGIQLVGRTWDEARLLRIAYAYEQATQWHHPPRL